MNAISLPEKQSLKLNISIKFTHACGESDHAKTDVQEVAKALKSRRFRFASEVELQVGIETAFQEDGVQFAREVQLAPGDRPDFMVGTVVVEVKIKGSLAAATRQLHRYAQSERVEAIVLVSSLLRLGNQPESMNGKPLVVVHVGAAFR